MELDFDLSFDELLAQIRSELPEEKPVVTEKAAVEQPTPAAEITEQAAEPVFVQTEPAADEQAEAMQEPEPEADEEPTPATEITEQAAEPVFIQTEPAADEQAEAMQETEPEADGLFVYHPQPAEEAEEVSVPVFKPFPETTLTEPEKIEPAQPEPAEADLPESEANEGIKIFDPAKAVITPKASEPVPEPLTDAQLNTEKTQQITFRAMKNSPMFFERSGVVAGKSKFGRTGDLSAIPSLMAAEEALTHWEPSEDDSIAKRSEAEEAPKETQMILPGFEKEPIKRNYIDEEQAENDLKENRSRKVDSFRLEGVEEKEKQITEDILDELTENSGEGRPGGKRFSKTKARLRANTQGVEYNRTQDKQKIYSFLNRKHLAHVIATALSALCSLGLLFSSAIPATADKIDATFAPEWLGNMPSSYFLSLLLLILCTFAGLPVYAEGITCFFRGNGKPNARTTVFAALAASFIQLIEASLTFNGTKAPCFALPAALTVTLFGIGSLISLSTIGKNFVFLSRLDRHELFAADTIKNTADIKRLAQDSVIGDADIRYSSRAKFASGFLAYSFAGDSVDDLCTWLMPVGCAVSLLIAVIVGFAKNDFSYAFSIFSCAVCMSVPVSSAAALALSLERANKQLRDDGAFLSSYAAAFEYETTNAVALEAEDIFPPACCDLHGIKQLGNVKLDEVVLTAASMILPLGGPIAALFDNVVMGCKELLSPVEDLMYEDRLGLSGWIRERKVFLGNRKMMEHHNIEIPPEVNEARYRQKGRRILYLADNGKLVAFFVVSYGSDIRIAEQIVRMEENGINLLVHTTDPNITENAIALTFGIPCNSVKVVSSSAGEVLKTYSTRMNPKAEAKLIHNGSPLAFLHAVRTAGRLCTVAGRINVQQIACCAAGLAITVLLALLTQTVSPLIVCLCSLIWLAVGLAVGLIGKD